MMGLSVTSAADVYGRRTHPATFIQPVIQESIGTHLGHETMIHQKGPRSAGHRAAVLERTDCGELVKQYDEPTASCTHRLPNDIAPPLCTTVTSVIAVRGSLMQTTETYVGYADKNSASDAAMHRLQIPAVKRPEVTGLAGSVVRCQNSGRDNAQTPNNTRATTRGQADRQTRRKCSPRLSILVAVSEGLAFLRV